MRSESGLALAGALIVWSWLRSSISSVNASEPDLPPLPLMSSLICSLRSVWSSAPVHTSKVADFTALMICWRCCGVICLGSCPACAPPSEPAFLSRTLRSSANLGTSIWAVMRLVFVPPTSSSPKLRVLEPVDRVQAELREGVVALLVLVLLLGLLEPGLELVEDLSGDLEGLALELQVALVAGRDRAGREVLAAAAEGEIEVELGEFAGALALERPGEGDLDGLTELLDPLRRDVDRDVQLAGCDLVVPGEGLLEQLVRIVAAPAATGGEHGGQRGDERQQNRRADES